VWRSLGRIPGPAAPDLVFQANQCLDTLVDSPADVRLGITTGVPLELQKALAGTPIEKAIDDVNALSQCEPHGETMGLWLDHQAFRPTLPAVDIVPAQKTFGLLVPIATLKQVFGTLWKGLPKRLNWDGKPDPGGNIELHDYSVELIEPNQLAFTLHGKSIADVPFSATATATFRVEDEVPTCDVAVRVDASEPGLAGVASIVLAQFTAPLMGKLEEGVEKAQRKIGKQATAVCQLSKALISELYLAKPKDESKPRLVLEVKYEDIRVSAPRGQQGLFGFGLTPPATHVRTPSVKVVVVPIPLGAGSTKIAVSYQLETHDLKGPLTVTWTPGNIQPLDSVTYTSGSTPVAIFTYSIPSRPPPYFLGRINVVVTDTDGFSAEAHKEIVLTAADLP
jgi:hypothetical protein